MNLKSSRGQVGLIVVVLVVLLLLGGVGLTVASLRFLLWVALVVLVVSAIVGYTRRS